VDRVQIVQQIAVLNQAYASSGFFFSYGDVETIVNPNWFNYVPNSIFDLQMRANLRYGGESELNVYSVSMSGGLLGLAYPFFFHRTIPIL
jgi:hypothetical protein